MLTVQPMWEVFFIYIFGSNQLTQNRQCFCILESFQSDILILALESIT